MITPQPVPTTYSLGNCSGFTPVSEIFTNLKRSNYIDDSINELSDDLIKILNLYLLVCLGICLGAVRVERTAAPLAGSPSR